MVSNKVMWWPECIQPGGRGCSLIWPIRGCATGQGMVFVLSVLNRVYNSARVCSRQGIQFRGSLSTVRMICASLFYYKEGTKIKGLVLNRVSILGIFCPKQGQGFKPSATYLYPNIGRVPPGVYSHPYPRKNRRWQPSYNRISAINSSPFEIRPH